MVVNIPSITRDDRIGSVFNSVFNVISKTETATEDVEWCFSSCTYLHPFYLAALSIYRISCEKKIIIRNLNYSLSNYLKSICFENPLDITNSPEEQLTEYREKSYTPICSFSSQEAAGDKAQTALLHLIEGRFKKGEFSIQTPLSYLMGELICNIEQHSRSPKGYFFTQYLPNERCLLVCIADIGDSIYASYVRNNVLLDEIGDNEAKALIRACSGYSTKNMKERGYGLTSSKKILVEGLKGAFFLLSGTAFHRHSTEETDYIQLPSSFRWNGTIALLRIPIDTPKNFDLYTYLSE